MIQRETITVKKYWILEGKSSKTPLQDKWLFWLSLSFPDRSVVIGWSTANEKKSDTYLGVVWQYGQTYKMTDYSCHIFFFTEVDQHGNVWQAVVRKHWRFGRAGELRLLFINRISKTEYVVNSGKLHILDLLKGSLTEKLSLK